MLQDALGAPVVGPMSSFALFVTLESELNPDEELALMADVRLAAAARGMTVEVRRCFGFAVVTTGVDPARIRRQPDSRRHPPARVLRHLRGTCATKYCHHCMKQGQPIPVLRCCEWPSAHLACWRSASMTHL